jgi:tRNA(Ile)-lysidine synthase
VARLSRTAELSGQTDQLLDDLGREDLTRCDARTDRIGTGISLEVLRMMPQRRRCNCLRYWLRQLQLPVPGERQLAELDRQLFAEAGARHSLCATLPGDDGDAGLRVYDGRLYALGHSWQPGRDEPSRLWPDPVKLLTLPGGDSVSWQRQGYGRGLAERWLAGPMSVGWRRGGERCQPAGRAHSQTLKKLLQEYRVPTWRRARIPLVMIDDELAAVGDVWVCKAFAATADEIGYGCHWRLSMEDID